MTETQPTLNPTEWAPDAARIPLTPPPGKTGWDGWSRKRKLWTVGGVAVGFFFVVGMCSSGVEKKSEDEPAAAAPTTAETTTVEAEPGNYSLALPPAPAPTDDEVKQAFQAFIDERADSGVMYAKAVTGVTVADGVVTVHADMSPALLELSPFDNLAEFFGVPAAFDDDQGVWLRETVNRVDVVNADGSSLGSMTAEELNRQAAG